MNEPKFTRGEWRIRGDEIGIADSSDTQSYGMMNFICHVDTYDFGKEQSEANAHLIAAAPEMYELLEYIKQYHCCDSDLCNSIIELLAKARGEKHD